MFNNFPPAPLPDRTVSDNMVKRGTAGQATDDGTARRRRDVICVPDN